MNQNPNARISRALNWLGRRPVRDTAETATQFKISGAPTILSTALACAICISPSAVHAALMAYEGFNYATATGNLLGQNGGFGWGASWQTVNNGASSVQASSLAAG